MATETERLAAMFNLSEQQFITGQPVEEGRIVRKPQPEQALALALALALGERDLQLTYEVINGKHGLFEGNLLVAVVGECASRPEHAAELARIIQSRVNSHTQLVAALEQMRSTLTPILRDHEVRGNWDRTEGYVLVAVNQIDAALSRVRAQGQ